MNPLLRLVIEAGEFTAAIERFRDYVTSQTLAAELDLGGDPAAKGLFVHSAEVAGAPIRVGLARVSD